jgi:hypothetical protein
MDGLAPKQGRKTIKPILPEWRERLVTPDRTAWAKALGTASYTRAAKSQLAAAGKAVHRGLTGSELPDGFPVSDTELGAMTLVLGWLAADQIRPNKGCAVPFELVAETLGDAAPSADGARLHVERIPARSELRFCVHVTPGEWFEVGLKNLKVTAIVAST